jgi:ribonuclease P protein component
VSDGAADETFGKSKRLLNKSDYSRVFDDAEWRASHRHLLMLARRNESTRHRLGLVIAKKHVRLAVTRNRIKRVAREFFRYLPEGSPTMDVVLLARPGIGELDNATLASILKQQWQRLLRQACEKTSGTGQDT